MIDIKFKKKKKSDKKKNMQVSEQSGAFEGTKLTLKFVKEPSAIRQWRDQLRANQVRKGRRVYPSMSKVCCVLSLSKNPPFPDRR